VVSREVAAAGPDGMSAEAPERLSVEPATATPKGIAEVPSLWISKDSSAPTPTGASEDSSADAGSYASVELTAARPE